MNRRDLLRTAAVSAVALPLHRYSLASTPRIAPSDKLTVACIGVGSQGLRVLLDLLRMPEVRVIAVCDVNRGSSGDYLDWGNDELRKKVRLALGDPSWGTKLPGPAAGREIAKQVTDAFYAKQGGDRSRSGSSPAGGCASYEDFRELLSKEKDLDAIAIGTPDHWHAPIAIAAMQAGKHVYSQKPMAHSVWECREMARVAKETGRASQVSIFNANSADSQRVHDLLTSGAIGPVRSIDIWTKRASKFWLQGLATPAKAETIPDGLNWDLWLGPAPARPFSRAYLPFIWRAWYDYGCGALGDMGEYGFDTISRAVDLGVADLIEASTTDLFPDCYPVASAVHFHFPKTAVRPELNLNWYDGGMEPARPSGLPAGEGIGNGGEGVIYHGDNGKLLTAFMGESPRLLSASGKLDRPYPVPLKTSERFDPTRPELGGTATGGNRGHYLEWVSACHGGPPARASYAFEAPIVENLMLGCIAVRTHEPLRWNAESSAFDGASDRATALIRPAYRAPFGIV